MSANNDAVGFEAWAIVELFGHSKIAGKVCEQTIGGATFIRVDVPAVNGAAAFTRLYGPGAIYAITPTTEEVVQQALRYMRAEPITVYTGPALPAPDDVDDGPPWDEDDN